MSFLFVVNRLDALIKRIEQLIAAITGKPVEELPPVEVAPPTVIMPQLPNRYEFFDIDLAVAHTDEPLGLKDLLAKNNSPYASYMTILLMPNAFSFKLNTTAQKAVDGAIGLEWDDFEITEIFITNAALAGTARIEVEYRVD